MTKDINLKNRVFTSLILLLLVFLISKFTYFLVYILILLGVICIIEFLNLINKIKLNKINFFISNFFFIIYIFILCLLFFYLSTFIQFKVIIFSLLLCCVASDIGGYVFGKLFKGPKLTKVSPNKTLSGAFGSLICSGIFFSTIIFIFTFNFSYKVLLIGIFTSIACQLGDLFFSYLKRKAKIKDTGNILPGHGGLLDRVDGILLGLPIGFFASILLF